jgi:Mitochondrial carrier protein
MHMSFDIWYRIVPYLRTYSKSNSQQHIDVRQIREISNAISINRPSDCRLPRRSTILTPGAVSTLTLHPLDLFKTKFQVDERNTRNSILRAVSSQYKSYGFRSLYRGLSANFSGSTASWGLYLYELLIQFMVRYDEKRHGRCARRQETWAGTAPYGLRFCGHVDVAVYESYMGVCTHNLVLKHGCLRNGRQMCTLTTDCLVLGANSDGLKKLWKNERLGGYYKGIVPALFGVSHGALQFMAYEHLKDWYGRQMVPHSDKDYVGVHILCGRVKDFCHSGMLPVSSRQVADTGPEGVRNAFI